MPIYKSKLFPESQLAHDLLDGYVGLEIGGSAHNAFGLNTFNVDYTDDMTTVYKLAEIEMCGEAMPVDIVAPGDDIPVPDKSFEFVISSHVIEHFFDPIKAIKEWMRISTKYIFVIAPLRDALESDRDKPVEPLGVLIDRFNGVIHPPAVDDHRHWTRWEPQGFANMLMWIYEQEWGKGWETCAVEVPDLKVGNGQCFVLKFTNI